MPNSLFVILVLSSTKATNSFRSGNMCRKYSCNPRIQLQTKDARFESITSLSDLLSSIKTNKSQPTRRLESPIFAGLQAQDDANNTPSPKTFVPWARIMLTFALGYGLGGAAGRRPSTISSKINFSQIALAALLLRDLWRSTPPWAKPRISRYVRKIAGVLGAYLGLTKEENDSLEEVEDADDITNLSNFAMKLQGVMNEAKKKIESDIEDIDSDIPSESPLKESKTGNQSTNDDFNLRASLLALIQLLWQIKFQRANSRDQLYRFSGSEVPEEMLVGMDEMFELADLAYDEHLSGKSLKVVLGEMGYVLVKHDKTAIPGYLGHYIAISSDSSKKKTAIIGVKGTSNFEDFLTDMCASSVEYNLTDPFYDGGGTSLQCHEGVFISSKRLADELIPVIKNLLLPSGYSLKIVGHSLGAGCGTILSILLRSRIPMLQENTDSGEERLRVWAFAPPPILDLKNALACSSFVTTVVNNCDVVPRANIFPLLVTFRLLRAVNKRLQERDLDMSNFRSTMAFLNKISKGKDGEMIMSADEVISKLDDSLEKIQLDDPDHLFVPGKAIILYDLWEKEKEREKKQTKTRKVMPPNGGNIETKANCDLQTNQTILEDIPTAEDAILTDGTCSVLRYIELDKRMFDDHMAPQYRSSIRAILSSSDCLIKE